MHTALLFSHQSWKHFYQFYWSVMTSNIQHAHFTATHKWDSPWANKEFSLYKLLCKRAKLAQNLYTIDVWLRCFDAKIKAI